MPKSTTKRSTPKLSELARHVVAPKGVTSTGWPAVCAKAAEFGVTFRPWQPDVGRLILAKRADGRYASTIGGTGLSIPRQVGKTFLVGAIVFALCLLRPKLTVIWTSHRLRTSEETFKKMQAFAKRKRIAPHIAKITLGSGEEAIEFRNGSRILFGARERGFGRGFDEVDVLIFDEAQILTEAALDDMIPATNQSRQPTGALLLFMGTPPKPTDPGETFTRMRTEALSGEDDDTGWVEFGADPDHTFTPLPSPLNAADWKQIAKGNPSYPDDTPPEAILRMRKKLGPDSFLREGAGIWPDPSAARPSVFGSGRWEACAAGSRPPEDAAALGLAVDLDRVWASIGASTADSHVDAVMRRRIGPWVVDEAERIYKSRLIPVAIDAGGPASNFIPEIEARGVKVIKAAFGDYVQACSDLYDAVQLKTASHGNTTELNDAVEAATWRGVGDRRVFARKNGEISMLEAATLARWAATQADPPEPFALWEDR